MFSEGDFRADMAIATSRKAYYAAIDDLVFFPAVAASVDAQPILQELALIRAHLSRAVLRQFADINPNTLGGASAGNQERDALQKLIDLIVKIGEQERRISSKD